MRIAALIWAMYLIAFVVFAESLALASDYHDQRAAGVNNETPKELEGVGLTEHLGAQIDLSLKFKNEAGVLVPLSTYVTGKKPVILDLAYYNCPSLCNFHLNGLNDAFKQLKWTVGDQYDFVVVSIDPREQPDVAAAKMENYVNAYGRPESKSGWHFMTGSEAEIRKLATQVGFDYHWDASTHQYAHTSAAYVLTPEGRIARYLRGIYFQPQTVKLALIEASDGRISGVIDNLLLYCFHFDTKENKYTLAAFSIMRGGAALIVLVLALFIAPYWIRQRRQEREGRAKI